jgi:hypothetical protein
MEEPRPLCCPEPDEALPLPIEEDQTEYYDGDDGVLDLLYELRYDK